MGETSVFKRITRDFIIIPKGYKRIKEPKNPKGKELYKTTYTETKKTLKDFFIHY